MKNVVNSDRGPKPIGPYSQAIVSGDFVFTSGQIPLDPETQALVTGDIRAQTERVMENLSAVLSAAGSGFDKVVKAPAGVRRKTVPRLLAPPLVVVP